MGVYLPRRGSQRGGCLAWVVLCTRNFLGLAFAIREKGRIFVVDRGE
jgi:hypothetical protein